MGKRPLNPFLMGMPTAAVYPMFPSLSA